MKNLYWWLSVTVLVLVGIAATVIARAAAASDKNKDGDFNFLNMNNENYRETAGTAHFSLSEWRCKDGTEVPKNFRGNVQALMEQLEVLRAAVGKPITVNSGYRTPAYNKKVGGATSSMHLVGKAADIVIPGMTPVQVRAKITELIKAGKMRDGGMGAYNTFTHYDIGTPRRWNG